MSMIEASKAIGRSKDYFYVMKSVNISLYNEILKYDNLILGYQTLLSELECLKNFIVDKYYENRDKLFEVMVQAGIKRNKVNNMVTRCCGATHQLVYKTLLTLRKIKEAYAFATKSTSHI